ncbi:MAG: CRISPR-associated endonuclease Cas2 [Eubacteriaceae bacterium]
MENRRYYLVAYDISNNKLRSKVKKRLEKYGYRIQFSVFKCRLTEKNRFRMLIELESLIDNFSENSLKSIQIYPLCQKCENESIQLGDVLVYPTWESSLVI